jgi:hypothetical protein
VLLIVPLLAACANPGTTVPRAATPGHQATVWVVYKHLPPGRVLCTTEAANLNWRLIDTRADAVTSADVMRGFPPVCPNGHVAASGPGFVVSTGTGVLDVLCNVDGTVRDSDPSDAASLGEAKRICAPST